jgi:4-carboxymuconolactone decarboxylase
MARLPDLAPETMSPAQRKVHDAIVSGPRGVVQGPLKVWLNSAELASRAQELGAFCRYHTSLPKRLSELAIIVTGAHWKAGFEWFVHAPEAMRRVSDATYKRAVAELGELGAVELVGILGYYALISMTIVAFEVPVPDGEPEPFA